MELLSWARASHGCRVSPVCPTRSLVPCCTFSAAWKSDCCAIQLLTGASQQLFLALQLPLTTAQEPKARSPGSDSSSTCQRWAEGAQLKRVPARTRDLAVPLVTAQPVFLQKWNEFLFLKPLDFVLLFFLIFADKEITWPVVNKSI